METGPPHHCYLLCLTLSILSTQNGKGTDKVQKCIGMDIHFRHESPIVLKLINPPLVFQLLQ